MGLLGYIESGQWQSLSPSLPRKESLLRENETGRLSFFEFVINNSLSHCAVFSRCDKDFIIENSIGFDGETIISSLSTADFWEGSIKKNDWTFFSKNDNTITTIIQFFSKSLKDKINFVGTFFSDDLILLVAYEKDTPLLEDFEKILKSFDNVDFSLPNEILSTTDSRITKLKLSFDYKNALIDFNSKYQSKINNAIATSKTKNALIIELEYKLYKLSNEYIDFTKNDFYEIQCNVFSEYNITNESLKSFINLNLKSIFGESVEYISYDD